MVEAPPAVPDDPLAVGRGVDLVLIQTVQAAGKTACVPEKLIFYVLCFMLMLM